MEEFGASVRIEQRFAPVRRVPRSYHFGGGAATKAGNPITDNALHFDAAGNPIWTWVIYQLKPIMDGIHPWTGEPTTLDSVWMPVDEAYSLDDARAKAMQLQAQLGT